MVWTCSGGALTVNLTGSPSGNDAVARTKLSCIVKPFRLDAVMASLEKIAGVEEVLVSEVRGYGRQKGHLDLYRGSEYDLTFLPKVCLEIYVDNTADAERVATEVTQAARTGRIGDGKIFRLSVEASTQEGLGRE